MPARTISGYLTITSVSKCPAATANKLDRVGRPLAGKAPRQCLDCRAGGPRMRHPRHAVMRGERTLMIRPAASGEIAARALRARR